MIDYDDVDDMADVGFGGCGPIIGVILFIAFILMIYFAEKNTIDCSQKHCNFGKPMLINHECSCVEK